MNLKHAFVLTGGIGTGKSTAASLLSLHGYSVLDADKIAHELFEEYNAQIAQLFPEVATKHTITRQALAPLIFANKSARARLEALLHPKVRARMLEQAQQLETHHQPYFLDIPLFFEIEGIKTYGISQVVLIYASRELQITRLQARNQLSLEQIEQRLNTQMDIEIKKSLSSFVLDNSKDLKHLQAEVERLLAQIKEG
ncbi:dephospho-CoA kinase [Helicobacter cynogastricus]|uniref:dephospho-CoA kinase n=1 Tax=Helicobacter cynogastricus TaxID=329937 RepID=UPI000CF109ED|nr:dephospho-CoA kinase [Helicobacter cynogastricus]